MNKRRPGRPEEPVTKNKIVYDDRPESDSWIVVREIRNQLVVEQTHNTGYIKVGDVLTHEQREDYMDKGGQIRDPKHTL